MKVYEIGTGYTPIPATMGAATEIVVEELTKAFQKLNIPVEIVDIKATVRKENALPITEVWVPGCFTGTDVKLGIMHKLKRVVYSVCLAQKLKKILKSSQEKVVLHFHNQYNMFFFLKLVPEKLRKKAVTAYTVHSHVWHGEWAEIEKTIKERYFQEVYSMEHADVVYVLNEKTLSNVVNYTAVYKENIRQIDNGVNTEIYKALEQKDEEKVQAGLQEKTVFIQVGSVCGRKNQLGSLELLMPFLQQDQNTVFLYAGGVIEPEYKEQIDRLAKDNSVSDQVQYWGELKPGAELNAFYNLAEAMVFPSKAEGFSLVIIEAMAAGVPVIISDKLEFPLAGDCVQYKDEKSFCEKVKEEILNADRRNVLSKHVANTVTEHYGWVEIAKDYFGGWKQ